MSDKATLLEFGFSESKATKALRITKNAGLQPALDWLANHAEDASGDEEEEVAGAEAGDEEGAPGGAAEAKSLKCLTFRNNALASYHGEKSGHDQFEESAEEIAPLTEAEKAIKLEELKQRMSEKKKLNAKRDAEEAKINEAIRRKGGQDQSQIKADLALKEANKEAIQRKKDKIDDARAKAAVKAQIEIDKRTRADKFAREKALRDGVAPPPPTADPTPVVAAKSTGTGEARVYEMTRLQIRLPGGGQPITTSVKSESTLGELKAFVKSQASAAGLESIVFTSTFPRKTYTDADDSKSMTELGLAPSSVLMLS